MFETVKESTQALLQSLAGTFVSDCKLHMSQQRIDFPP